MYTLQELTFTRVMPRKDGIFAFAKYPQWWTEYGFLLQPDGKVIGKTHDGNWVELTQELSSFVCGKIKAILREEPGRVYA